MPRARSSTITYFTRRGPHERLPRRMSEEDVEEEYRKKKFGTPGPIDAWLAAWIRKGAGTSSSLDSDSDLDSPLAPDEVRCIVHLQRLKVSLEVSLIDTSNPLLYRQNDAQSSAPHSSSLAPCTLHLVIGRVADCFAESELERLNLRT